MGDHGLALRGVHTHVKKSLRMVPRGGLEPPRPLGH